MKIPLSEPINLPTEFGDVLVRYFGNKDSEISEVAGQKGIILTRSAVPQSPTLVRLHSSCLFGEALHAIDCDCAQQLSMSIREIMKADGALIYSYEEGRGAGLQKKVEAIRLQQVRGIDTVAAFEELGLPSDLRSYEGASAVVKSLLGEEAEIILLSNNPSKRAALEKNGIRVLEMRSLIPDNLSEGQRDYLGGKAERLGHIIPPELALRRNSLKN